MSKTGVITIYLNSVDYAEVKRLADYRRISVNEWCKKRIVTIVRGSIVHNPVCTITPKG